MIDRHKITPTPVRFSDDIKEWLRQKAKKDERSLNSTLNRLVREAMDREQQEQAQA